MRILRALAILSSTVLAAAPRTPVPAVESKPHQCTVPGVSKGALCATYPVWEDRDRKAGRKIGLNIVILPALGKEKAEPVFVFGGGPGEGITEAAPTYASLLITRAHHDIVSSINAAPEDRIRWTAIFTVTRPTYRKSSLVCSKRVQFAPVASVWRRSPICGCTPLR